MRKTFRISVCLSQLRAAMAAFPDCRTGRNCQYSIETLGMTAFTTFFLQSPSFRSHHTLLRQLTPRGNAARLFHLPQIPCSNQVRRVLDAVDPRYLVSVYDSLFQRLDRQGLLQTMRGFKRDVLIPLDGTQYFSSKTIQCPQCSTTTHHDGSVTYSHTALLPAIVMPGAPFVLPLAPEFIRPQDGHAKQDCEPMAAKRWIAEFRRRHKRIGVTVLGDDLYATRPMCDTVLAHRCNFIFVCKPGSHPTLSARIAALQRTNRLSSKTVRCFRGGRWERDRYRVATNVPVCAEDEAVRVTWVDLTTTVEATGEEVYHTGFITNHAVTLDTVEALVAAGRSRWKIENEGHNTLKHHGYHLTHNFGHGEHFLSSLLVSLLLLAFAFHTLLDLAQGPFHTLRSRLPSRCEVFHDCRALLRYLAFSSVHHLLTWMVSSLTWKASPG